MSSITTSSDQEPQLPELPETVLPALENLTDALGIPRNVLASDEEITYAWKELPRELRQVPENIRHQLGELFVRMCVAASAGLFDGAINYAWNASILQLREKVKNFCLPVVAKILQEDFEEKHLLELQDSELLNLSLKLNLITEDGYFFLDQCRSVRNSFSAAHPTIGELNDREFVTFLNRCVKYALAESSSLKGVDIGAFISAVKGNRFTEQQCSLWIERLSSTHDAQRELLFGMVHGIYCDPSTPEQARLNALDLCLEYKDKFTTSIRSNLIDRHSDYLAKGETQRHKASLEFFEKLSALQLLNESERHAIISNAIDRLWKVHQATNNFHNEPPFAERLEEISRQGAIPETIQEQYVQTIVGCYMGNSYSYSFNAEKFYIAMIRSFSPKEIFYMVDIPKSNSLARNKFQSYPRCNRRFRQALKLIDSSSVPDQARMEYNKLIK